MKLDLTTLVRYHDQQISSRSLSTKLEIVNPITIYAMDKDESISRETSPYTKLIQVLDGQLEIELDSGTTEVLAAQQILSIPRQMVHSFHAIEKCQFLQIEL